MKEKAAAHGWDIEKEEIRDVYGDDLIKTRTSWRRNRRTGALIDFLIVDALDWTTVIPVTPDNKLIMIKQYRQGAEKLGAEFPGGCIEKNEDPREAGARELEEETGYRAQSITPLINLSPNPALMSNRNYFYVAENVTPTGKVSLDPGENIATITRSLEEVMEMIKTGEFDHALHIAAFCYWGMMTPRTEYHHY